MSYYFVEIFREDPEILETYKDFVKKVIHYKSGDVTEVELKEALEELYIPFEKKYNIAIAADKEGFSRFVLEVLIQLDSHLLYKTEKCISNIIKQGFNGDKVTQKELVELFNEKFKKICSMQKQHFTDLKKLPKEKKQGELPWIIHLNFMKIITALLKTQEEKNDQIQFELFFDINTVTLEELPSGEKRKEAEVTACFEFIKYILPNYSIYEKTAIEKAESTMLHNYDKFIDTPHPGASDVKGQTTISSENPQQKKGGCVPKIAALIVIMLLTGSLLFFLARFRFLGERPYELTNKVFSAYRTGVDIHAYLPINYKVTRTGDNGTTKLFKGDTCYTGDRITIKYTYPDECYVTIICIDSDGVQHVPGFPPDKNPFHFATGNTKITSFRLNDTAGLEVYYYLISKEPFSFEKDIKKPLLKVFQAGNTKGPVRDDYRLQLKKTIRQSNFYFNHLSK